MTEPLFTLPQKLTARQQTAYEYVAAHDGVPADELGAHLHAVAGVHAAYARCQFCHATGREVCRSKALRPLVTYRRTRDGHLYLLRDRRRSSAAVTQLADLPGESFEDMFGGEAA